MGLFASAHALVFFGLQLALFAAFAFPTATLVDSLRVALAGRGARIDAPEMAVGVFAALGRASLVAGANGAVLAAAYTMTLVPHADRLHVAMSLCPAFIIYGVVFRLVVALPLESLAFSRLGRR